MDEILYPLCAVASWAALFYKLRDLRRAPTSPALRSFCAALAAICCLFTFATPAVYVAFDRLVGVPNLARLMTHGSAMVFSVAVQRLLLHWAYPHVEARRRARRRVWLFFPAILAMTIFFILAPVDEDTTEFTVRYGNAPFIPEYMAIYLGYVGVALADIVRLSWRYAAMAGRPFLRVGLRCTAIGAGFGFAYSAEKALYIGGRAADLTLVPAGLQEVLSPVLAAPGTVLVLVGLTIPAWGPRLAALRAWIGRYRAYRRLRSLWLALYQATPEIALDAPASLHDRRWPRDLDYRLVRRVVEIRDGRLALRPHLSAAAARAARRAGERAGLAGSRLQATVEAAVIAEAIHAKPRNVEPVDRYTFEVRGGDDLASETAWLVQVARAFTHSPIVAAAVRDSGQAIRAAADADA